MKDLMSTRPSLNSASNTLRAINEGTGNDGNDDRRVHDFNWKSGKFKFLNLMRLIQVEHLYITHKPSGKGVGFAENDVSNPPTSEVSSLPLISISTLA